MMRFIMPVILVIASLAIFFVLTNPLYGEIKDLRSRVLSYDQALSNSKVLENERDKLTAKYNSLNKDDLARLQKLLPDNVDNIRLILEIEQIASPYGMTLKEVKYNVTKEEEKNEQSPLAVSAGIVQGKGIPQSKEYGTWDLEFSTTGSYDNFLNFTRDLENNLRIVDVSSVQFSSDAGTGTADLPSGTYKYNFKIKTYWLKD